MKSQIGSVMVINLILAVVVLFKDVFLASYLGTSSEADAFLLAYFIPDTIGNNLLATALGVACVPVFARLQAAGEHKRLSRTITHLTFYTIIFAFLLLVLTYLTRETFMGRIGAGFSSDTLGLTVRLLEIILPTILIYPLISIGIASLQVHNSFNIPALAPVFFNAFLLAAVWYLKLFAVPLAQGVYLLSLVILLGTLGVWLFVGVNEQVKRRKEGRQQLNWQEVEIQQALIQNGEAVDARSGDIVYADFLRLFGPYLLVLLFAQTVYLVERFLAAGLAEGTVAGLNYAYRLAQFPLWVFVAAISAVVFPAMAKVVGLGQREELKEQFSQALYLVLIITLPLSIVFFGLREPIVALVLQRGSFGLASVNITTEIIAGYALAIVWQGFVVLGMRVCLVMGQTKIALLAGFVAAGANIVLDVNLVKIMGAAGLGYGAAIGAMINCGILFFLLARVLGREQGIKLRIHRQSVFWKIGLANLPVIALTWLLARLWLELGPSAGIIMRYGYGLLAAFVLVATYVLSLRSLKLRVRLN